jgi:hypothetical protein
MRFFVALLLRMTSENRVSRWILTSGLLESLDIKPRPSFQASNEDRKKVNETHAI